MKNKYITQNQIEILKIVQSFRYLPVKVLLSITKEMKIYSYKQSLSHVILGLEKQGYLRSFLYGNNWKVVYITKLGAKQLAFELGLNIKELLIPNQGQKVQFATLEHTVKIATLYQEMYSVFKNHGIEIQEWLGDQQVQCQYKFRSARTGKNIRRNLNPDGYIKTLVAGKPKEVFLEYDTGTMDKEQLVRKFMRYFEYYAYGNWKSKYLSFPKILFLTERSKQRLDNLLADEKFTIEDALRNREKFLKGENLIFRAIGMSENIRSINSDVIREFINNKPIFYKYDQSWAENLPQLLQS